jgi:hypothetical protein
MAAAKCKNLKADFTIKPIYLPRTENNLTQGAPSLNPDPPDSIRQKVAPQRTIAELCRFRQDSHIPTASVRLIEPFLTIIDSIMRG